MKSLLRLLLVSFLSCLIYYCSVKEFKDYKGQSVKSRILNNGVILKEKTIGFDSTIIRPDLCFLDDHDRVILIDYDNMMFHVFNVYTEIHYSFGKGKGKGPGELLNPSSIFIKDSLIYCCDPQNGKITVYSINGDFIRDIKCNSIIPYDIANVKRDSIFIMSDIYRIKPFKILDINGKQLGEFGQCFTRKNLDFPTYHESYVLEIKEDRFVHVYKRLGIMGIYKGSKLLFWRETIDGVRDPAVYKREVMKGVVIKYVDRKADYTSIHSGCNNKWLLNQVYLVEKKQVYYDLYDIDSLDYRFSFQIPLNVTSFDLSQRFLATINNEGVSLWRIVQ